MFELFTIALFQILAMTGKPTVTTNGGSGGWGHDVTTNGGSGGWGHDVTTNGGSGGWGHD